MAGDMDRAILIAGPTASGKSELALRVAGETGGVIINADSMQVYEVLDVLSARPGREDLALAPHFLYGFLPPQRRCSSGIWLRAVADLLDGADTKGRTRIFVGGTGLYFKGLLEGLARVPEVPAEIVREVNALVAPLSRRQRKQMLAEMDPQMARILAEPDRQRLARALGVLKATGRSLASWQEEKSQGLLDGHEVQKIILDPGREVLNARIEKRFHRMFEGGAVREVERLLELGLDPSLPVMKAIGVREIAGWLAGDLKREEAIEKAIIASRQYAKRQRTWFRRQMADWRWQ